MMAMSPSSPGPAGHHQLEGGEVALLVGGVGDPLAVGRVGDPHGADGAVEGDAREHQRGGGGVDGQHVVGVLLVGADDGGDDVDLVAEALGERGAQRAVDQAAGEDGLVGGPALTAEERAGDLAGGVHPLLDVDGEGEEVDPFPDAPGGGGRGQDHGVADTGHHCALASWASLPVSKDRVFSVPLTAADTEMASAMIVSLLVVGAAAASSQLSATRAGCHPGSWRLAADPVRRCGVCVANMARAARRPLPVCPASYRRRPSLAIMARYRSTSCS